MASRRYPLGANLKTERVIYEPPPPPPSPGEYPKKIPLWNLTGTVVGKEMNKGAVAFVFGAAAFACLIMYYGNAKMGRLVRAIDGSAYATPDKIEMDHARKKNFLLHAADNDIDDKTYDIALHRMEKLQKDVYTSGAWAYHDHGRVRWSSSQPEYGVKD